MLVTLRKIAAVGAIAFLAILGGTATASAQTSAPHYPNGITFKNDSTTRCIDDSDFAFRTNICNNSAYQDWGNIAPVGSNQFQNFFTHRCIDDSDFAFRTNICNNSDNQKWILHANGDGFTLENAATHRCVDDSDFAFRTITCNYNLHQIFSFFV